MRVTTIFSAAFILAILVAACQPPANTNTVSSGNANANASTAVQNLTVVDRPQRIKDMMAARGEQDAAVPQLRIVFPVDGSNIQTSTVKVGLDLYGELKGYVPGMDPETKMGNHVHVILDNQPYEAYYSLGQPFELRNVSDGEHTLRVFPSRPWHESYKNDGAFQMVRFTVLGGGAGIVNRPPPTANQQPSNAQSNVVGATPLPEGKEMQESKAGPVDPTKPLLTYSRPKGEYSGADADAIMIDFWLSNAILVGDGGEFRVRYTIDGGEPRFIDNWAPIWLSGWTNGKHTVKLELVDKNGNLVENGGYNSTTREITVSK